nr:unnamed protein product [Spirometra erinaceieuropaei]
MVSFYRRFLPHCDDLTLSLTNTLSSPKHSFELSADALADFGKVKAALVDVTLLMHFSPDAPISLLVCACNAVVGVAHQQSLPDSTVPSAFFSRKPSKAETRYSTFGCELPAVYLAVKYFEFAIFTDHKSLSFALHSTSNRLNPRETRQLDYISQFTSATLTDQAMRVADALSRSSIAHVHLYPFKTIRGATDRKGGQRQLEEVGAGYTFFWTGRPRAERRNAGVAFAIRNDIMGRLPCLPQGINDRLMSLRLPLRRGGPIRHHHQRLRSDHDQPRRRQRQILRGPARPLGDCADGGLVGCPWRLQRPRRHRPYCLERSAGSPRSPRLKRQWSATAPHLRRTPPYPDKHVLLSAGAREGHFEASSVASVAPAGLCPRPKA